MKKKKKEKEYVTFLGPFCGNPYLGMKGSKQNSMEIIDEWCEELGLKSVNKK